jgi:hypothetical protein
MLIKTAATPATRARATTLDSSSRTAIATANPMIATTVITLCLKVLSILCRLTEDSVGASRYSYPAYQSEHCTARDRYTRNGK